MVRTMPGIKLRDKSLSIGNIPCNNNRGTNFNSISLPNICNDSFPRTTTNDATLEQDYFKHLCRRCFSNHLGDPGSGDFVCFSCRLVQGVIFESSPEWWQLKTKTYQRVFYFNECCSCWVCEEPRIDDEAWEVIHGASKKFIKRNGVKRITREVINKILKSVRLTPEFMKKHQSQKFKKTLMSKKRFYDKYSEKWKTISWKLTGKRPRLPPPELVAKVKHLFAACQTPFENFRHADDCDKRGDCDRVFDCWHNFINYDYVFRKLLQVVELKFNMVDVYSTYKDEFPLVSKKIRDHKLRPMFRRICLYNQWPCPDDE